CGAWDNSLSAHWVF
nr:immunoglobulin light chain junction region [Macaca mulatta]MPN79737.1 immunoglobulin light chain junction region [Macaca mulatta]MPN79776.1 immunoglobulin light chain junction region [Macaca mulatta]MPN79780.1 immunoglobulin light chain junction region [Macaca mulatta]MPN79790.1 immunoglobulin light chain junction region [Macaca mulatta]